MTQKIGCVQHDCEACATQAAELRRLQAENEALRKQMEAQKDEWLSWNAKRQGLEADAALPLP